MSVIARIGLVLMAAGAAVGTRGPQQLPQWRLVEPAALIIGSDADPHAEFLRIGGVALTAAHEVVVANTGSQELRVFDQGGKFLRSYGRSGAGPGEFGSMSWVARAGDSLFLYDFSKRRVSVFSMRTGFLSTTLLQPVSASEFAYPVARLRNGGLLVLPLKATSMRHPDGTYRDSIRVGVVHTSQHDSIVWLGTFPYMTHLAVNPTNAERAMAVGIYRFGPGLSLTVAGDRIWLGDSGQPELVAVSPSGQTVARARLSWAPRQFDPAAFARAKQRELDGVRDDAGRMAIEARYSPKYRPPTEPYFSSLLPALDGSVWVQRYRTDPGDAAEYHVIDAAGRPLANVATPKGFTPYEVGADYVLGVRRDVDGVESIAMFRLVKR